jgi:hypothetical protein
MKPVFVGLFRDALQTNIDRAVARGLDRREATPIKHIAMTKRASGEDRTQSPFPPISTAPPSSMSLRNARGRMLQSSVLRSAPSGGSKECAVAADMLPAEAPSSGFAIAELVRDKLRVASISRKQEIRGEGKQGPSGHRRRPDEGHPQFLLFSKANLSPDRRRRYDAIKKHGLKAENNRVQVVTRHKSASATPRSTECLQLKTGHGTNLRNWGRSAIRRAAWPPLLTTNVRLNWSDKPLKTCCFLRPLKKSRLNELVSIRRWPTVILTYLLTHTLESVRKQPNESSDAVLPLS